MKYGIYTIVLGTFLLCACKNNKVEITGMYCEYSVNPICVDSPHPRFIWNYYSEAGFDQEGYCLYAEKLGISINSVRTLKQNAYKKLKGLLKDYFYLLFLLDFTSWS